MIDEDVIALLVCPQTKQSLQFADKAILQKINDLIQQNKLHNVGGNLVKDSIDGGLLREDQGVLYPIRNNIPVLLADEGICLEKVGSSD